MLQHFAGSWAEEVELGGGNTAKAKGNAKWVLGGTHLRSEFVIETEAGQIHHMAMMGWDPVGATYVTWMFSNNGAPVVFKGAWDAQAKTFTQTSFPDNDGITTQSVSEVVGTDRIEWTVEMRDDAGTVQGRLKGVDSRVP